MERVIEVLKQKGIHVSQGAISATYVKSTKLETASEVGKIWNKFHAWKILVNSKFNYCFNKHSEIKQYLFMLGLGKRY